MIDTILPILIGVVVAGILFLYALHTFRKKSVLLMKAVYADRDYDQYRKLLKSLSCRLFLSKKQRLILNMSVCLGENNDEELLTVFQQLERQKLLPQEMLDLYCNKLRYYIKKRDQQNVEKLYEEVNEEFKEETASYIKGILKEIYYMYEVDYKENDQLLNEMKQLYGNITVEQSKGIFAARCTRLYLKKRDIENAKSYYKKACACLDKEIVKELLCGCDLKVFS